MSLSAKQKCVGPPKPTTILDLNDDVLRETFRHLNPSDLCVVADVCSAFKRNAQAEFALQHKKLLVSTFDDINDIDIDSVNESNYNWQYGLHLRQLAPALRNFISSLVSIRIDIDPFSEHRNHSLQAVKMLTKYYGESLVELHLNYFIITAVMAQQLRPLLSRLQALKLEECIWPSEMLSFCMQLGTLSLDGRHSKFDAAVTFPKLSSFFVSGYCFSDRSIKHLLVLNPQLKEISIARAGRITIGIIPLIAKYTPQIEKFTFRCDCNHSINFVAGAKHLKRLTALKSLEINCSNHSIACILKELMAAQITLECLKLYYFPMDQEFINEISEWKHLKTLGLTEELCDHPFKLSDILMIVQNLSELAELELFGWESRSINDLVEIVRWAPKLRKLECRVDRDLDEDMLMKFRDVVAKRKEKCPLLLISVSIKEGSSTHKFG